MKTPFTFYQKMQIFIICFLFSVLCSNAIAQNQNHVWTFPENIINFNPLTQIPGLPVALPNGPSSGWDYSGQTTTSVHNAMQDKDGNLLFFIQDGNIYDKDGYFIDVMMAINYAVIPGGYEVCIVPDPGNCERYYIFSSGGNSNFLTPFYSILDMSVPNQWTTGRYGKLEEDGIYGTTAFDLTSILPVSWFRTLPEYAASKLRTDNSRFVFLHNGLFAIYRLIITQSGLAYDGTINVGTGAELSESQVNRPEVELVEISSGYRIACAATVTGGAPPGLKIFSITLDMNGDAIAGTENSVYLHTNTSGIEPIVHGLEFSPDGLYLYFTHEINNLEPNPIEFIDNTGARTYLDVLNADDFSHSQIELGPDGKLYFATYNRLETLSDPDNPDIVNWNYNAVSLTNYLAGTSYILPDQIDGVDYTSIFTVDQVCCLDNTSWDVDINGFTANLVFNGSKIQTWKPGTGNNPWNSISGIIKVQSSIIIPEGYNITIRDMTFEFAPRTFNNPPPHTKKGGYIIVDKGTNYSTNKGARLTLNNTVFKSYTDCGKGMWEGVWVVGDASAVQGSFSNSKQGWLIMTNGSIIEDAYRGIYVGRFSNNDPVVGMPVSGSYGGIVQAVTNSKFYNNQIDVIFNSYTTANSLSFFSNCMFETNIKPLLDGAALPLVHTFIINESGLRFLGCTFQNTSPAYSTEVNSGYGIYGFNAGFTVAPLWTTRCNFNNLTYGIRAWNLTLKYVSVDQTEFTNNYRGIYLGNVNWATVTSNNFVIYPYTIDYNSQNAAYGLYFDRCKAFHVESNSFKTTTGNKDANDYGIIVNEENPNRAACHQNDEIYRNNFGYLLVGCQAQGDNSETPYIEGQGNDCYDGATVANNLGLKYLCNNYQSGSMGLYDINVTDDNSGTTPVFGNIAYQQGICSELSTITPAGNRFSHSFCLTDQSPFPVDNNDYAITATVTPANPTTINYSMHNNNNGRTKPYCYTPQPNGLAFTQCYVDFSKSSCPSKLNLDPPKLQPVIDSYEKSIDSINTILADADAEKLMSVISSGNPAEIREILLEETPYLSDRVLIATVNKGLPPGILKQIIIPNSPLTQDVTDALNLITLPQGIRNEINAAQTGVSGRTEIIDLQTYYLGQRNYTVDELIRAYLSDTIPERGMKEAIELLRKYGLSESQCDITKAYLSLGDTVNARKQIDTLAMTGCNQTVCTMLNAILSFEKSAENYYVIKSDAALAEDVRMVAADSSSRESVSAEGLLKLVFGTEFSEWIEPNNFSSNAKISNSSEEPAVITSANSNITIFPNPANSLTTVIYNLADKSINNMFYVFDITGREMEEVKLSKDEYQIIIDTKNYSDGVYFCTLISDGVAIDKIKLVVIK